MLPKESPMDALFKGVAAGSHIAATRQRNQQMYAQVQEFQQQQDLREREFMAQNESRTLQNEVVRGKLDDDTADFNTARDFYPKLAAVPALEAGSMERPVFRNIARQASVEKAIATKTAQGILTQQTEGRSRLLSLAAEYEDNTDPEYVAKATKLFSQYNLPPSDWNMFQNHQEHAQRIKIAQDAEDRRLKQQQQTTGLIDQLDADGNVIAKQFVDQTTGEPIRGWHAVPAKGGGWKYIKTPEAIDPQDLTPTQNISRLRAMGTIIAGNITALKADVSPAADAQRLKLHSELDKIEAELSALGTPNKAPKARSTGQQYGPPAPVTTESPAAPAPDNDPLGLFK